MPGRLPGDPTVPEAYLLEAMAQAAGLLVSAEGPVFFAQVRDFRSMREIRPGDRMRIEANLLQGFGALRRCGVEASVDGEIACRAEVVLSASGETDIRRGI